MRSETGDRGQPAGTNGSEEGRQDRRTKGPVSIQDKLGIRNISNARYGRKEGQCRRKRLGEKNVVLFVGVEKKEPTVVL